ncbi:class I SAM-dependent methyltransferase [Flavobacterium difficile]|uniref:SAM-dependent methyltransferase n=1 Tax=Flavobacterium difficile TaxID=2709659 RepID=A0ABX0I2B7_9FLAO|nr:SAM-dependent methyltransferase [Flavobacterium difficile]NHM01320.1 SAM-dependent methyltransferase [Flavobacterium difficile]
MKTLNKAYWENRYKNNDAVWDIGHISTPLKEYIDQLENKNIKILIPGAGNAYELDYLIEKGFQNVYVIDYAQQPIDTIIKRNPNLKDHLICDDFFNHTEVYDLIIEQTFFCALDPTLRENYVLKMSDLLTKKGKIAGLLFNFPLSEVGPPFGGSHEEYIKLFSEKFTVKTLEPAYNSIKPRANKELFFKFEKK